MTDVSSVRFRGLIAPEEPVITGDNRMFARNSLTHRPTPLPVMFKRSLSSGHDGAVAVGRLDNIVYEPGRGWVGEGVFLDPRVVPEVAEAVYLVREGVSSPSVDLQPNITAEIVPHPRVPDQRVVRFLQGRTMGFTFVPYAAFEEVEILATDSDEVVMASIMGTQFAVFGGSWSRLPIADRETPFEFESAIKRILEWSGGNPSRFRHAFLYQDSSNDANMHQSYYLPIADVLGGKLALIPRAVFSAAAFMSNAHGGLPKISDQEKERIRNVITDIYDVLRDRFADPRVRPPWQRGGRQGARGAEDQAPKEE